MPLDEWEERLLNDWIEHVHGIKGLDEFFCLCEDGEEFARLDGLFTSDQLRRIADANDELKAYREADGPLPFLTASGITIDDKDKGEEVFLLQYCRPCNQQAPKIDKYYGKRCPFCGALLETLILVELKNPAVLGHPKAVNFFEGTTVRNFMEIGRVVQKENEDGSESTGTGTDGRAEGEQQTRPYSGEDLTAEENDVRSQVVQEGGEQTAEEKQSGEEGPES